MSNDAKTTEHTWHVASPKHLSAAYSSLNKALSVAEEMRSIGDPDYEPSHIVHTTRVSTVDRENIALPSSNLAVDDVVPILREKLAKLGGQAPVGEEALAWAVRETLSVLTATHA